MSIVNRLLYCLSGHLPCRLIGRDGVPYLERYFLFRVPVLNWQGYLHRFVGNDPDGLHDHPWKWAFSLILHGGYRETYQEDDGRIVTRKLDAGCFNIFGPAYRHHIDLQGRSAWTLFLHGPRIKGWGFFRKNGYHPESVAGEQRHPKWWETAPKGKHANRQGLTDDQKS